MITLVSEMTRRQSSRVIASSRGSVALPKAPPCLPTDGAVALLAGAAGVAILCDDVATEEQQASRSAIIASIESSRPLRCGRSVMFSSSPIESSDASKAPRGLAEAARWGPERGVPNGECDPALGGRGGRLAGVPVAERAGDVPGRTPSTPRGDSGGLPASTDAQREAVAWRSPSAALLDASVAHVGNRSSYMLQRARRIVRHHPQVHQAGG